MRARLSYCTLPYEEWMRYGKCKTQNPAIFFPPDGHNSLTRPAIEICNFCPVQLKCLSYALTHTIDDGIWGGTSRNQRRRILRARRARTSPKLRLANAPIAAAEYRYG